MHHFFECTFIQRQANGRNGLGGQECGRDRRRASRTRCTAGLAAGTSSNHLVLRAVALCGSVGVGVAAAFVFSGALLPLVIARILTTMTPSLTTTTAMPAPAAPATTVPRLNLVVAATPANPTQSSTMIFSRTTSRPHMNHLRPKVWKAATRICLSTRLTERRHLSQWLPQPPSLASGLTRGANVARAGTSRILSTRPPMPKRGTRRSSEAHGRAANASHHPHRLANPDCATGRSADSSEVPFLLSCPFLPPRLGPYAPLFRCDTDNTNSTTRKEYKHERHCGSLPVGMPWWHCADRGRVWRTAAAALQCYGDGRRGQQRENYYTLGPDLKGEISSLWKEIERLVYCSRWGDDRLRAPTSGAPTAAARTGRQG